MHNHVILTGRLTHTPELRQTPSGVFVCKFSIAVQRKYNKNKTEQESDFIEIEAWRGTAEFVSKYFDKGDMIDITGRLKTSPLKTIPIHRQQQIRRRRIFLPLLRNLRKSQTAICRSK